MSQAVSDKEKLDNLCINTIRFLAVDGVQKANSGHPGMPMGNADLAYLLWTKIMKYNPRDPKWINRDRFVLSAGHGSMLLYSMLYLTGYDVTMDDLKSFRQWGSRTPGHPEYGCLPGVELTTGPLGQGFATGVGMAIAERFLAARFNRPGYSLIDHYIYAICGDGDLMEGISHEAASLAGHLGLGNLIYMYDDNHITIEGDTDLAFSEDVLKRFEAYGWHTVRVDGYDHAAVEAAIKVAQAEKDRPSLIACRQHIGYGSPNKHDTCEVHGAPLGVEEVKLTKQNLGWPLEPDFLVPDEALKVFRAAVEKGKASEEAWAKNLAAYRKEFPEQAALWEQMIEGKGNDEWQKHLPVFSHEEKPLASRAASGKVLNAIAPYLPSLLGGSADLASSNNTYLKGLGSIKKGDFSGRNLHFGVREFGMSAMTNGLALYGGIIPYCATFLVFADYARSGMRSSALMEVPVVYVMTHDSIGLGEDGPTHQPIEHLASLRAMPNMIVIRPCDANETVEAWRYAITHRDAPIVLALSRQGLPTLDRSKYGAAANLAKGAYILSEAGGPVQVLLIATGSEVHAALSAQAKLAEKGINARVVSMPSWELFDKQPKAYRDEVLPPAVKARVAVEAGVTMGWAKYVGIDGVVIGLDRFGASAPDKKLMEAFGFTGDNVAAKTMELLGK